MTTEKLTAEQMRALREELVAWEMSEARIYGEPMTRRMAETKVGAGLARHTA
jgi:hypothetical protein